MKERSPGKWAIILDGRDQSGKRKRVWHSFRGTRRQARIEAAKLITEIEKGAAVEPGRLTVEQYMAQWLTHIRAGVSPKTLEGYTSKVSAGIVPALGQTGLAKLQPITISTAYAKMRERLSPRSVHHTHRVLSQALAQAVRWRLIPRNPCDDVDPPKVEKPELKVWDVNTIQRAIELARPWRVYMPMLLAVMCGLRRGEIVALRWRSIDLDRAQLSVIESAEQTKGRVRLKPPKTGKGRTVALPAMVVSELRAHRRRQTEELLQFGVGLSDNVFVCAREDGKMLQPNSLYHAWMLFLATTDLPRIRFHDLRHSHATLMLKRNVHPKIVSERLGHSRVALTLDTYSHVLPNMQTEAAAAVDAAFGGAQKGGGGKIG